MSKDSLQDYERNFRPKQTNKLKNNHVTSAEDKT